MSFDKLLGNEPIKAYLKKAVESNLLHHTLLFSGLDGIGKSLFAKALAQKLLLASATRIQLERHPDLFLFRPEGKSGQHPIERMRELIEEVRKSPFEADRKVFILFEAERMQPAAANALLKTLEEPELNSTIILLTSAPQEMLTTILSRCLQLTFQPIPNELIAEWLQKHHQLPPERAHQLSRLSNGSMATALRFMNNEPMIKAQKLLFDALDQHLPAWQVIEEIDALFEELEGFEYKSHVEQLLEAYLMRARDQEVYASHADLSLLYFPNQAPCLHSLSKALAKVARIRDALDRNVKLSACLDQLFC